MNYYEVRMGKEMSFEEVWQDIIGNVGEEVYTLAQGVRNTIIRVDGDSITVMSERTGNERRLRKRYFKHFVDHLLNQGSLELRNLPKRYWRYKGAIMMAILAKLDYIGYETSPIKLFLSRNGG